MKFNNRHTLVTPEWAIDTCTFRLRHFEPFISGTKICFLKFLLSFTFVLSVRNYLAVLFLVF